MRASGDIFVRLTSNDAGAPPRVAKNIVGWGAGNHVTKLFGLTESEIFDDPHPYRVNGSRI